MKKYIVKSTMHKSGEFIGRFAGVNVRSGIPVNLTEDSISAIRCAKTLLYEAPTGVVSESPMCEIEAVSQ